MTFLCHRLATTYRIDSNKVPNFKLKPLPCNRIKRDNWNTSPPQQPHGRVTISLEQPIVSLQVLWYRYAFFPFSSFPCSNGSKRDFHYMGYGHTKMAPGKKDRGHCIQDCIPQRKQRTTDPPHEYVCNPFEIERPQTTYGIFCDCPIWKWGTLWRRINQENVFHHARYVLF